MRPPSFLLIRCQHCRATATIGVDVEATDLPEGCIRVDWTALGAFWRAHTGPIVGVETRPQR